MPIQLNNSISPTSQYGELTTGASGNYSLTLPAAISPTGFLYAPTTTTLSFALPANTTWTGASFTVTSAFYNDSNYSDQAFGSINVKANGTTNANLGLYPKAAGALTVAVADNTATGGNIRGSYNVDLQLNRTSATEVASTTSGSIYGGYANIVNGNVTLLPLAAYNCDSCNIGGANGNQCIVSSVAYNGGATHATAFTAGRAAIICANSNIGLSQFGVTQSQWSATMGGYYNCPCQIYTASFGYQFTNQQTLTGQSPQNCFGHWISVPTLGIGGRATATAQTIFLDNSLSFRYQMPVTATTAASAFYSCIAIVANTGDNTRAAYRLELVVAAYNTTTLSAPVTLIVTLLYGDAAWTAVLTWAFVNGGGSTWNFSITQTSGVTKTFGVTVFMEQLNIFA